MMTRYATRNTYLPPGETRRCASGCRGTGRRRSNPGWVAALLGLAVAGSGLAADDPVVAQRGADRITLSQARAMLASIDPEARRRFDSPQELAGLLRTVLLQRAVLRQADAQGWDRKPDVAALAQQARDLAIGQSFLAAQASVPAGYPAESDIQAAYEQAKPRLMQPRAYHLAQVFVPAAQAPEAAARRSLAALGRDASRSGGLARAASGLHGAVYSDLGWLPDTQIEPAVRAVVSGLQEGASSAPICLPNGCHVVQLIATRPAGPAPLATVRAALVRALRQQKQAAGEQAYANTLLAQAPIQLNEIQLSQLGAP